jgi:hypothetical protein
MASFMDKNMLSHQFVNYFDQISILLKLLCGNLEKKFELSIEDSQIFHPSSVCRF